MANKLVHQPDRPALRACELLTEDKIKEIPGVKKVRVQSSKWPRRNFFMKAAPRM